MPSVAETIPEIEPDKLRANLSTPALVEAAIRNNEATLASNGALVCNTGERTGRSPKDKYLESVPAIHDQIWWGEVNRPTTPERFDAALRIAKRYLADQPQVYRFDGFVGADPQYRLGVRVLSHLAWHALFARTLFIPVGSRAAGPDAVWKHDWTVIDAGGHELTSQQRTELGVTSGVHIAQSLSRKTVVILGTRYAGEIKKSLFYAMNYDMPESDVLPMHCSCNVAKDNPENVALFFGLSGTGKTTLSADPRRALVGDDEHGWSAAGVFNFEGGCYAKCIGLKPDTEPEIHRAIRFGSVLENVVIDPNTSRPNYDDGAITENTRATYPVDYIDNARIPSIAGHPKDIIFLTADASGVLPPVARLTTEQAMYYFINGYTSKLAGTEAGVKEPTPNFSACFGAPFLPRPPLIYAEMLAQRCKEHGTRVWLVNTGWTGGPYGTGQRIPLKHTRAIIHAITTDALDNTRFDADPVFALAVPDSVRDVPAELLAPRNTWADKDDYDSAARQLAEQFRENDARFEMPDDARRAGPNTG